MPVLREQRRRELSSHLWGPRPFGSKASGRWLESGALERERRSWTSDRSSSPVAQRDERPPVAELQLGLEARSSAKSSPLRFGDSPGRAYGAGTGASSFGEVSVAHEAPSLGEVSVASRGVFDQTSGRAGASSSFSYEAARFGFGDALTNPGSEPRSSRGFGFGEARELNFVSKAAQQQQPGPFSEPGAFGSEAAPDAAERESALELGVLRGDWRAATGSSSAAATVAAGRRPAVAGASPSPGAGSSPASVAGARASSSGGGPGGGGGGSGPSPGGGDAQSPPMSSGAPCGACKFLRRKCVRGCIFAPYFGAEQGAARFAAVHKIFGASNVSKLLLHIPLPKRCDAVLTISYEAQARISDPVYGCVATIFALQQQVASLQAELAMVQAQLASRLAAAALQHQHVQQHQHQHQHQHHSATSAYDSSGISMTIPSPNQNIMTGAGGGSAGPYGGSSSRVKEEASFHTFHYDVGMGGSSMSIDSGANHGQHLLHLDSYNPGSQKMTTRHLLADHGRGEPDMGELQALAHALLRRK